jgi:hypothetical protein
LDPAFLHFLGHGHHERFHFRSMACESLLFLLFRAENILIVQFFQDADIGVERNAVELKERLDSGRKIQLESFAVGIRQPVHAFP